VLLADIGGGLIFPMKWNGYIVFAVIGMKSIVIILCGQENWKGIYKLEIKGNREMYS